MSYFNSKIKNILLNESIDLIIPGIIELLMDIGLDKFLKNFDCEDKSAFDEIKNKIIYLKKHNKLKEAAKLEQFLISKYDECLNKR